MNMTQPGRAVPRVAAAAIALMTAATAVACDKPRALGQMNNVVVATTDVGWATLGDDLIEALEPRTFTVRDERIFDVAHVDPREGEWERLRLVRQVIVIGEPGDAWVAEPLRRRGGAAPAPPAIVQVRNVWAQNQLVTVLLIPPGSRVEAAAPLVPQAGATLLRQFEQYSRERMFASGANTALQDSLRAGAGFSILLPEVYYYSELRPGLFVFRNDFPDPSRLIRSVQVDSRPTAEVEFSAAAAREWRASLAREYTDPVQVTEEEIAATRELQLDGRRALEIQGVWSNPPGAWPAAGPYLTRLVQCGDRTFLLDAWLYAPGTPKFEYMVQLATILDSFEC